MHRSSFFFFPTPIPTHQHCALFPSFQSWKTRIRITLVYIKSLTSLYKWRHSNTIVPFRLLLFDKVDSLMRFVINQPHLYFLYHIWTAVFNSSNIRKVHILCCRITRAVYSETMIRVCAKQLRRKTSFRFITHLHLITPPEHGSLFFLLVSLMKQKQVDKRTLHRSSAGFQSAVSLPLSWYLNSYWVLVYWQ